MLGSFVALIPRRRGRALSTEESYISRKILLFTFFHFINLDTFNLKLIIKKEITIFYDSDPKAEEVYLYIFGKMCIYIYLYLW